ncbi:RsmE family RNA methyltransferase [Ignavibacteria bacterium]|nr:16S rRNA (uracil(1498)-N(3))-methyltransferase [Bacteroidota bacterium]MCZ2132415.1 16S rRNA (uracil(1498)-N(3))-methyltransferase [Bacteroidota bacterium]
MECLYAPELRAGIKTVNISDYDEVRHTKALRLRKGERAMLTNGCGLCAIAALNCSASNSASFTVLEELPDFGETGRRLGLALGILDSRDRMEFAVEKAVELGITDFFPLICERSQRKTASTERLNAKILAAVKQCRRAVLPALHAAVGISGFIAHSATDFKSFILADADGKPPTSVADSAVIIVGPEGGFSAHEIAIINTGAAHLQRLSLAPRRLRAETAAIAALAVINRY